LFFDEENKPLLVYMKYDINGNNQLFVAKAEKGKWFIKQVSNWDYRWEFSGPGSITFEIRIKDAGVENNKIKIGYWHKIRGDGELAIDLNSLDLMEDNKVEVQEKKEYPEELMQSKRKDEGMSVHWMKLRGAGQNANEYCGFRWETMGKRRFYEAPEIPVKPSALQLYKFRKE
jgi:hypothetical protein